MTGPLTDRLKPCYDEWIRTKGASAETWMDLIADPFEFRSLAMGDDHGATFTAPKSRRDEVRGYFDGLAAEWEMLEFRVDRYVEQGDTVCAIGWNAWRNRKTGKSFESPKVDIWRFEGGKAVAFMEFYDTAKIYAAATG